MSDAKRYHCYGKDELGYQYDALFREETDGDWVAFSDYAPLKARLAEAERTLPCGCHHSLDDSYGGCILHTALRCHEEMETESEKREARLEEAERLLLKFHTAGPAGITALIDEVPAFLGITDSEDASHE